MKPIDSPVLAVMPGIVQGPEGPELHWYGIAKGRLSEELDSELRVVALPGCPNAITIAWDRDWDNPWADDYVETIADSSWELAEDYPEAHAERKRKLMEALPRLMERMAEFCLENDDDKEEPS